MAEPEKSLLQQIRDKEQEFSKKIDTARAEAESMVAAARTDAEDLLCTADTAGKTSAEKVYWNERGRTEADIEALKSAAEQEMKRASREGELNLPAAAERIIRYVTME
ncbi:MAG: V-type ATPase subunit subunit G family protein [Methanoregula sp.]|jgi:vacuolar-type H+-ATPase subunit H